MSSHTTDWHPGRVSKEYREQYDKIFQDKEPEEKEIWDWDDEDPIPLEPL